MVPLPLACLCALGAWPPSSGGVLRARLAHSPPPPRPGTAGVLAARGQKRLSGTGSPLGGKLLQEVWPRWTEGAGRPLRINLPRPLDGPAHQWLAAAAPSGRSATCA